MGRVENTVYFCTPIVSFGTCLFVKALLSNGCVYMLIKNPLPSNVYCFVVYFDVVASNGSTSNNINLCDNNACFNIDQFSFEVT
jgi:hypothetical protein